MRSTNQSRGDVVLYRAEDGKTALDVRLEGETVWLTQAQMVQLFQRNQSVISRHINNVFKERELDPKSNMQKMHSANSDKPVLYYSLDAVISVGYRVNSKRGTQFRIWATRTIRDHLIQGYTLHERRLRERGVAELEQAVQLLTRTLTNQALVSHEGKGVLDIVSSYARSWLLLQQYDENRLGIPEKRHPAKASISYDQAARGHRNAQSPIARTGAGLRCGAICMRNLVPDMGLGMTPEWIPASAGMTRCVGAAHGRWR